MSWVRLDDRYPQHPKLVQAGPQAAWLNVCALAYCSAHLTDGFVPAGAVPTLTDYERLGTPHTELVGVLVRRGLWTTEDGGYQIHDYLVYNPDRVTVMSRRDRARTRKRQERDKSVTNVAPAPAPAPAGSPSRIRPREKSASHSSAGADARPSPRDLFELWNRTVTGLPTATALSDERSRKAAKRLYKQPNLAWWEETIRIADASPFCRGEGERGWRLDFDFLVANGTNALRIREGKYSERENGTDPPMSKALARSLPGLQRFARKGAP